jgi:hypothetical protein
MMSAHLSPAVQGLVREWWESREAGDLPPEREMELRLARAILDDVTTDETYCPSHDARVDWARAIVRGRWSDERPHAVGGMEAAVEFLLGKGPATMSGKMLAAGDC